MINLPSAVADRLRCPRCGTATGAQAKSLTCPGCDASYPVEGGIPILLSSASSLFDAATATRLDDHVFSAGHSGRLGRVLRRALPTNAANLFAEHAFQTIGERLATSSAKKPAALVLGSGDDGAHLDVLDRYRVDVVRSDVVAGPGVSLVLDAHDIPFADQTFDAVVLQAVLEHVLDPARCVEEVWRVLKPGGLIYAETPFMQQVHGGRYDFTRFTLLGHRRLFRRFAQIDSGIVAGPGAALAWSWEYFLMSFCRTARTRLLARLIGRLTSFYLKRFDPMLARRPGGSDAASALGFLGYRSETTLDDADLVSGYLGMSG